MSPTSSPSSSAGSPPDSSPADTTFSASDVASASTSRPSFVPLSFSPLSRLPPSASSEQPYQSFRTRKQSPSLSPPTQHSILTSEAAAAATRRHEEFDYAAGANPVKTEEFANVPGTSSSHQHSSPQIGKKKRTRTLTTPQQSAVLHALLAQSRFPTTAMREEVGRAIGLSARKVQVWFQNQRQKARKPRSQGRSASVEPSQPTGGSAPPPQFGPFNPVPISQSFSAESVPVPAAGSSSAADLSRKSSVYDEDLASSGSPSIMRGLPMPIPTPGSGGGTSSSMESEFHMGVGTSPNYSPVSTTTMFNEPRHFHHPDHRVGVGGSGMPLKIELSPVLLRSHLLDSRHGHKESATPPQQPFLPYSPSAGTRAVNPNRSPSSVYPFTMAAMREEDKPTRPSDTFFPDAPIILPPIRLNNDPTSRGSSDSNSNTLVRPDPHLRYSASFPSYSQDTGSLRSTPSSLTRSSASGLPPPFTLQPRPQWDWDRPLGPVLPSIGLPPNTTNMDIVHSSTSGLRQPQQSPSFMHPRPRTTSDPALPPLETRQSALLTEPWPLPPNRSIDSSEETQRQAIIEREDQQRLQYDVTKTTTTASGEKSSTETQPSDSPPSNRPGSDEDSQRQHRSSAFTLQPRDYHVE